jgi:tetratricopeptide (TPR) repeat protein
MIADVKKTPVAVVPSTTPSTLVFGANSALEAGSEMSIELEVALVDASPSGETVRSPLSSGARLFEGIAATARHRARRSPDSAAAWTHAGFAALADKNVVDAREAFEHALRVEPSNRNAILGLARTAHQAGELFEAERLLRGLMDLAPGDVEALVSLAVVLVSQGRPEEGLALLTSKAAGLPEHASFLAARGSIHLLLGRPQLAISDLRKAVRLKPEWVHPRNVLGMAELRAGRQGAAERQFMAAVRTAPMHEASLLNLSNVLRQQGRWDDILAHIDRYWRPGTASAQIAHRAAEACLEIANARLARAWLEPVRGQGESPAECAAIWNNLGVAYDRLNLLDQAESAFSKSIAVRPKDVNVANRARVLLEQGAKEAAVAWLSHWVTQDEVVGAGIETTLAAALISLRQYEQALRVATSAAHRPEATVSTFAMLSFLCADFLRDYDAGVRVALKGLEKWPTSATLINNVAYSLLMGDKITDAAAWLSSIKFDDVAPNTKVYVLATTGLLELKRGNVQGGRDLYESALALAGKAELRERVKAKRDLESARALLREGQSSEAVRLLLRASDGPEGAEPYVSHAREELNLLKAGSDG